MKERYYKVVIAVLSVCLVCSIGALLFDRIEDAVKFSPTEFDWWGGN